MTSADALTRAIETILVDFYNEDEDYTAFLTVIEDEVALPASASLLGTPVTVVRLDYTDPARGLVAVCRGPHGTGQVTFADPGLPPPTRWPPGCTPPTATTSAANHSLRSPDPTGSGHPTDRQRIIECRRSTSSHDPRQIRR